MRKQLFSFEQLIKFSENIKLKGGGVNPNLPSPLCTPLAQDVCVQESHAGLLFSDFK